MNWGSRIAAFLLPIVLLLPFASKPFQGDDHVFIWVAEQIARQPLDFFGFEVDYGVEKVPIYLVNHNPPLVSYWLALFGVMTGWDIVALHFGMYVFAGVAALGMHEFARDLGVRPGIAAALGVLTPAFLVSASTLMTDTALLACYVWAVVAWRRGFALNSKAWLAASMACVAIASLVKFFGITLLLLLIVDGVLRSPKPRAWWAWFILPLAVFGAFQAYVQARYGITSISDAAGVALAEKWRTGETSATRPFLALVFLGGSLLPLGIPAAARAGFRLVGVAAVLAITLCAPIMGGYSLAQLFIGESTPYGWEVLIHIAVFVFVGAVILLALARALPGVPRNDAVLLACWILGTLVFTVFVNHYISVRTLLPALPPIATLVLTGRQWPRLDAAACAVGLALCVWLNVADDDVARHDLRAASRAIDRATQDSTVLHYVAYWGFEYHLMKSGAKPLALAQKQSIAEPTRALMEPGDYLVVDAYAADAWTPLPPGFEVVEEIEQPYRTAAATFDVYAMAGFYSHRIGVLPYRLGRIEPETFLLVKWTGR